MILYRLLLKTPKTKYCQLDADMEFVNNNGVEIALATIRGDETGLAHHMSPDSFENMPACNCNRLKGDGVQFIDPAKWCQRCSQQIEATSDAFSDRDHIPA
jgi:hypothetical protein